MQIRSFHVRPNIPKPLQALSDIAANLWYSWNFEAIELFMRLDYDAWIESNMNPTRTLSSVAQSRLEELADDDSFLAALESVRHNMERYLDRDPWNDDAGIKRTDGLIAYFSMEYGLDKSLPIYSGGLGVLSGDHLKTASDLGVPLVGVGLLYRQGFFTQYLNADGFQQESYPENDWYTMPVTQCRGSDGEHLTVSVGIEDRIVEAAVWKVDVGRIPLYLLDTNIPANAENDRMITATLYGGDRETRIRQEIVLGIGGVRALEALGIEPTVYHMNEGHSAFLALERIRSIEVKIGLSFAEAHLAVRASNVFTTHTPVPAGNEHFDPELMRTHFDTTATELGLEWDDFLSLGRENPSDQDEHFCMTVLALKCSILANAVSSLHGVVSRAMWRNVWPGVPDAEIPIGHVTNGVHPRTWIAHGTIDLLDRYFGPRFHDEPGERQIWTRMERISDQELWRNHERRRERLVAFARDRIRSQLSRRGATASRLALAEDMLSPSTLTVSFARRFATYKRGTLLFHDPERLIRLLSDPDRPVQLIFAGKAHPSDTPGKELIRTINHFADRPDVRSRIVFLEDYDINVAKYLTSGSDIWLNTPRRPMEASGTSGMKAAMNGVLNVSVLDGWWAEAYDASIGWQIGGGENYEDTDRQDEIESKALYDLLEREVVPTFYERGRDGLPRSWISMMKSAMQRIGHDFSSHRMLEQYVGNYYQPAHEQGLLLSNEGFTGAKKLSAHLKHLEKHWSGIEIESFGNGATELIVGEQLHVTASVVLGPLEPGDIAVELCHGRIDSLGGLVETTQQPMDLVSEAEGRANFECNIRAETSGRRGFGVRVVPNHPLLSSQIYPGLITWA